MTKSDESGPTVCGLKYAWKENVLPAATVRGVAGTPVTLKFAFPVKLKFETVTPTLAKQVMVVVLEGVLRSAVPKLTGDVQFKGRLTGDPKPQR